MKLWRAGQERGDTIVEVLIAIGVVSLVLGGAYNSTNHNLQNTRSAQEQGAAIKVAESQLEQLKALADKAGGLGTPPASFCIVVSGSNLTTVDSTSPGAPCDFNAQGVKAATGDQPVYHTAITQPTPNAFTIKLTWQDVNGKRTDGIQMSYKVYRK